MASRSSLVFTYGSLMFDPVWSYVVRGAHLSARAVLPDYQRFAIRDETYPGVLSRPGQQVQGRLYLDVSPADLRLLDQFEGRDYRRISASVTVLEPVGSLPAASMVEAEIYLYLPADRVEDRDWDPEWFETVGLRRFISRFCSPGSV